MSIFFGLSVRLIPGLLPVLSILMIVSVPIPHGQIFCRFILFIGGIRTRLSGRPRTQPPLVTVAERTVTFCSRQGLLVLAVHKVQAAIPHRTPPPPPPMCEPAPYCRTPVGESGLAPLEGAPWLDQLKVCVDVCVVNCCCFRARRREGLVIPRGMLVHFHVGAGASETPSLRFGLILRHSCQRCNAWSESRHVEVRGDITATK